MTLRGRGHVTTEAEIGDMRPKATEAGRHRDQSLPLEPPEAAGTLISASDMSFGPLASETVREHICTGIKHQVWDNLL